MTQSVMTNRQIQMFGCTLEELKESVEDSITFKVAGPVMYAMSVMSDAQEMMVRNMTEQARQSINVAKWVLSEYAMEKRV
jgi:hypothetical protein